MSPEFGYLLKIDAKDQQEADTLAEFIHRIRGVKRLTPEPSAPVINTQETKDVMQTAFNTNTFGDRRVKTAEEAAQTLHVTGAYIRQLARNGNIAGIKVGRDWILDADSVENFQLSRFRPSR